MKTKKSVVAALESSLVTHLRFGAAMSRVALARALDVAPSTVGLYVDRLIESGFIREGSKAHGRSGRPSITLELNPSAGQFVGVDFEASRLSAIAVDFSQNTLKRHQATIGASDDAASVVLKIKQAVDAVAVQRRPLLGVGIAVPGAVDGERGVAVHYNYIRNWQNVPLAAALSPHFKAPIHLENNIRAMALAERWFGQARRTENFVCIGIRSGVGAGIVVRGELLRGTNNLAGEIGGWRRPLKSAAVEGAATLEQQASVRAILQRIDAEARSGVETSLRLKDDTFVEFPEVLAAARNGDALVLAVLADAACAIGQTISQLNLLLNPEQVVIAGPLAELGNAFLDPIREVVTALTPPLHAQPPRIIASRLGDFGGALGAAAMAVNLWTPQR